MRIGQIPCFWKTCRITMRAGTIRTTCLLSLIHISYGELERRGVIYAAKGRGNFISDNMTVLRERRLEEIGAQIGALAAQARTLGADEDRLRGWLQKKGVDRA